ncbi:MAG TPA: PPOX class F420-dependent oxidoreductase [Pseudonocardiaceae bacterium]|nr:PPOX class F420-dependent oxidoreductase [Pseudonocardiaceae bacterium]
MGMTEHFNEKIRQLLDGRNVATVATIGADGGPHTSVVWIGRDGDTVLFSSTAERQKVRNLRRDPRVSLTVFAADNPYQSVDIRGTAELVEDPEKALPETLSQKYLGQSYPPEPPETRRFTVRVTPRRITSFGLDE